MSTYCTLAQVRRELALHSIAPYSVEYDDRIYELITSISARIDSLMFSDTPFFEPFYETRNIEPRYMQSRDGKRLSLDKPLLSLTSVFIGQTELLVGTDVKAFSRTGKPPFYEIARISECPSYWGWYTSPCSEGETVSVTGTWGYAENYPKDWQALDALTDAVNASATLLNVSSVSGRGINAVAPRFSAGNLIKIGDEIMRVFQASEENNTLSVLRGENGTTASAHLNGASVMVWKTPADISQAVAKQTGLMLARTGAYTTVEITGMSEMRYPKDLMESFRGVLSKYAHA